LRTRNLAMLKALPTEFWENYGVHQERGKESIAHIVRMYAGHDLNHRGQVDNIVKRRGILLSVGHGSSG